MMQGDAYGLPFEIMTGNGLADGETFAEIELSMAHLRKSLTQREIKYLPEEKAFIALLTQEETMLLHSGKQPIQLRVKTLKGDVIGIEMGDIDVIASLSKVVL